MVDCHELLAFVKDSRDALRVEAENRALGNEDTTELDKLVARATALLDQASEGEAVERNEEYESGFGRGLSADPPTVDFWSCEADYREGYFDGRIARLRIAEAHGAAKVVRDWLNEGNEHAALSELEEY